MLRAFSLAAFLAIFACGISVAQTASPGEAKACWTKQQKTGLASEIAPRPGASGARIPAPRRSLAAFLETPAELRGVIRGVKLADGLKLVALTFDLCEAGHEIAGYDGRIIDYLRNNSVSATFFAGGKWLMTHSERAQQIIADPLFEVANHGWHHANFQAITGEVLHNEIADAQAAYEEIRERLMARQCVLSEPPAAFTPPQRMTLLRFPYGTCNENALDAAAKAGMLAIQWDVATGDPDPKQSAKSIAARVLQRARPGSIILGHANGRGYNTAAALPLFVPDLKEQGYRFVTVSELLAAGTPLIVDQCYDLIAGDTERWVASARLRRDAQNQHAKRGNTNLGWNPFRQ